MEFQKSVAIDRNRRLLERFTMKLPSNVVTATQELPEQVVATHNISSSGVFFETDKIYPVGTKVLLNISLELGGNNTTAPGARFKIEGTVVRSEPKGMAVAFDQDHVTSIKTQPVKTGKFGPVMIGIVGNDPLLNDLLAARLSMEIGVSCCHSQSLEQIVEKAASDLVLLDCSQISVAQLLESIAEDQPSATMTNTAFFNVCDEKSVELEALNCGVRGIFYKNTPFKVLTRGISAILDNELWFSREAMSAYLLGRNLRDAGLSQTHHDNSNELSLREKEILHMLANGASNKHIADALFLSLNTVKSHIYNIYRKIDVPNRLQASLWASKHLKSEASTS